MSIPYEAGTAFTTPTCVSAWVEYPFKNFGDTTTKVYHHIMEVARNSYVPLAFDDTMTSADEKPERSPFSDDSAAYWVHDTEPQVKDGVNVTFERIFANIPAARQEGAGLFPFTFPKIATSEVTTLVSASNGNESIAHVVGSSATVTFDVTSGEAATLREGQKVKLTHNAGGNFEKDVGGTWINTGPYFIISDITGLTVEAQIEGSIDDFRTSITPITTFKVEVVLFVRAETENFDSHSYIDVSYYKKASILSVPLKSKFAPYINTTGLPTDELEPKTGTPLTTPTTEEYLDFIADNTYLVAQPSSVDRWRGNIWEVRTLMVQPR